MPGPQVDELVTQILKTLPRVNNLEEAFHDVRNGLENLLTGLSGTLSDELNEARDIVADQIENEGSRCATCGRI